MILRAETKEDILRVNEYLKKNVFAPATTEFRFKEQGGQLIGAYGLEEKIFIEPMFAENKIASLELLTDALATVRTLGYKKVHILTDKPEIIKLIKERYGAIEWGTGVSELLIPISKIK